MTGQPLKESAKRVQAALAARGFAFEVREFPAGTRTSAEAAAAIGCAVGQIAKSLVFRARESGRPVLVIASGANRVDETAVGALLGERIGRAEPDFVRAATGFAIGGVPPVGHREAPAGTLRANVTSPGGTTLEALKVLMAPDGLQALMTRAIAEATRRSRELAS